MRTIWVLLLCFPAANLVHGLGAVEVGWATDASSVGDDTATEMRMVCYPVPSACNDAPSHWVVHSVKKTACCCLYSIATTPILCIPHTSPYL